MNKRLRDVLWISISPICVSCAIDPEGLYEPDDDEQAIGLCGQVPEEEPNVIVKSAVGLEYGYRRPFHRSGVDGTTDDPLDLPMEYGIQGGHHVDLSLRFIGELNPDLVDITIELIVDEPLTDIFYGQHETRDWYLLFPDEDEREGCYFHQARIFLFDQRALLSNH